MKLIRIAILTLFSATLLSSCGVDENPIFGPGTGVVNFGESSISVKENSGMFTIPLELTGEPGGYPVTVNIEATGTTDINKVLIITSTTIKITDANNSFVQLKPVWNPGSDENYNITLTIKSANGANIGTTSTCAIYVENVRALRYGQYDFTSISGTPSTWTLILREGVDGSYVMENMLDIADTPKLVGEYDEATKTLTFNGRVNGKGSASYFGQIGWGMRGLDNLLFQGGGADGKEPIVFEVNDAMELASTQSRFMFALLPPDGSGGFEDPIMLGDFNGGTLEYTGEAIPEEWPF